MKLAVTLILPVIQVVLPVWVPTRGMSIIVRATASLRDLETDFESDSPAQCPSGWAQATTVTNSYFGRDATQLTLGTDTTAVVCCPSYVELFLYRFLSLTR